VNNGWYIYFPPEDPNLNSYFIENGFPDGGPVPNGPLLGVSLGVSFGAASFGTSLGASFDAFFAVFPGLKYFSNPLGGFSEK
jgi:hypothetical protein